MSVAIRFERYIPSAVPEPTTPARRTQHAEAPDRGGFACEAPEMHRGRPCEAPDAGFGRSNHMENQFTHGRSQS